MLSTMTLQRILDHIISIVYPIRCVHCARSGAVLCTACHAAILFQVQHIHTHVAAAARYDQPPLRSALWALKYHHKRHIPARFAPQLADTLAIAFPHLSSPITLVPIPLSKKRMRERGYNQAAHIARAIAKTRPDTFIVREDILKKTRHTPPQVHTDTKQERQANLKDCFAADPVDINDGTVVVIDDITTTGTTFAEARKALRQAGITHIHCFAVAH